MIVDDQRVPGTVIDISVRDSNVVRLTFMSDEKAIGVQERYSRLCVNQSATIPNQFHKKAFHSEVNRVSDGVGRRPGPNA